ncbi:MAG: hypothetical protein R3C45_21720 [Phycisphaerales bacterium]
MVTLDEYTAPVVATWQAGLGRAAVFTGEADGKFTGPIGTWDSFGDLLTSLARWVESRDRTPLPDTLLVRQRVDEGVLTVELMMDPENPEPGLPGEPEVRLLVGKPGMTPDRITGQLRYTQTDTLAADFPLAGDEAVATRHRRPGPTRQGHAPARQALAFLEYRLAHQRRRDARTLADITGGVARTELASLSGRTCPPSTAACRSPTGSDCCGGIHPVGSARTPHRLGVRLGPALDQCADAPPSCPPKRRSKRCKSDHTMRVARGRKTTSSIPQPSAQQPSAIPIRHLNSPTPSSGKFPGASGACPPCWTRPAVEPIAAPAKTINS